MTWTLISFYLMLGALYSYFVMTSVGFQLMLDSYENKFENNFQRNLSLTVTMIILIVCWFPLLMAAFSNRN